ncbi:hypothetical protein BU17DRAFT_62612 [Hysterangium stoloniferum]|nr:hypothetical protein BU17DRAFT_62612 [Hysterangium stoloniferum]
MTPMQNSASKGKCSQIKLTNEQKAQQRERAAGLTKDLNRAHEELLIQAEKISAEHNRTTQWTKSQLLLGSKMQGQKRSASAWNAFTRKEMEAVNKTQKLTFSTDLPLDVKARYNSLSDEDYAALIEELCDVREDRNAIKCRQPKAVLCDVTETFQALTHEVHAAHLHTGIEIFYVAAHSSLDQTYEPKSYFSPISQQFCKDILNMDYTVLLHRFEAYALAGVHSEKRPSVHGKSSRKALEGDCHNMINVGLANILLAYNIDSPAKINYDHYEIQVVQQWGVILSQWPCNQFINPGSLNGIENVHLLWQALQEGKCKWVKLTEAELAAWILSTPNITSSPNNTAPSDTPNMASSHSDTSSRNPPNTVSSIGNDKSSADYVMSVK